MRLFAKSMIVIAILVTSLTAGVSPSSAAVNLLNNGSFETGDFTGWTRSGNLDFTSVVPGDAQDGNFYVSEGPIGSPGYLSQTFKDVPGSTLVISGWVRSGDTSSFAGFDFFVNFDFNDTSVVLVGFAPTQDWTRYTASVIATGEDIFRIGFRNDPAFGSLDHFSVIMAGGVPEPSTWLLILAGFFGLAFLTRNRTGSARV